MQKKIIKGRNFQQVEIKKKPQKTAAEINNTNTKKQKNN